MKFLLRKQLNQNQDAGGSVDVDDLDSPGATTVVTASTDTTTDKNADPPVTTAPVTGDLVNNVNTQPPTSSSSEPKTDQQQLEGKEGQQSGDEDDDDVNVFALADEQLGYKIDVTTLPEGVDGLVEFGRRVGAEEAKRAVEKEYEDLRRDAAPAVELAQWLKSGRSETDFYLSKIETPRIEPAALDTAPASTVEAIIYKNFIKQGFSEDMANTFTKNAIDTNTAVAVAKQITEVENKKADEAKAIADQAAAVKAQENYKAFVKDIEAREEHIKKGQLKGITIPVAEQQAFIDANFYNAGNPEFPGQSAIDIAMAQMTKEEIDLYRYLVWKKLDVNSLVQARAKTVNVNAAILGKKSGSSRMAGSANRTNGGDDDRTLDSPTN